jgi:hypothetical protein
VIDTLQLAAMQRAIGAIDQQPLRVAGRLAGLGSDELEAGIPTWAWITIALGAGVAVGVIYGEAAKAKVGRLTRRVRG